MARSSMGLVAKIGLVGHVEDYININNNHVTIHRSLFSREQNGGMESVANMTSEDGNL